MIQRRIILGSILTILTGVTVLKAQINPIIPPSPEAISLAKYINYPVDYSTGLPDINIPLYEITAGTLKLPIVLKYHAAGIKVSEPTGWIGTGWSLSAEPQIFRSVNVKADEVGYLQNNNLGNANNGQYYYRQVAQGIYEEEPDDFFYQLLSKNGRFFYYKPNNNSNQYSIKTLPYEPIRITNLNESLFSVIDDNGTIYNFGKTIGGAFCTETTTDASSGFSPVITTWKAAEIISASKRDTFFFKYSNSTNESILSGSPDKVIVEDKSSYDYFDVSSVGPGYLVPLLQRPIPVLQSINRSVNAYQVGVNGLEPDSYEYSYIDRQPEGYIVGTIKIQEIAFSGGKVVFEKTGQSLDNIKVYNKKNELVKQIKLYSSLVGPDPVTRRLWLDSVVVSGSSIEKAERYAFTYKSQQLPSFASKQTDYWGYFNNSQNDYSKVFIESQTLDVVAKANTSVTKTISLGVANRMPNETALMAGMIDKIVWPTGGYTKYEFEINKYKNESGMWLMLCQTVFMNTPHIITLVIILSAESIQTGIISLAYLVPQKNRGKQQRLLQRLLVGK